MRKPTLKGLKKKAWKVFSEWIRQCGSDSNGINTCVTCGVKKHWKELHASHFIPGRRNSILFIEENCHPACYVCNVLKHGALENYYPFMLETYGQRKIDEIKRLKNTNVKFSREDLEDIIKRYGGV